MNCGFTQSRTVGTPSSPAIPTPPSTEMNLISRDIADPVCLCHTSFIRQDGPDGKSEDEKPQKVATGLWQLQNA